MNYSDIKALAESRGLKPVPRKKVDLVRAVQSHEGNTACYATGASAACGQDGCLWRGDCVAADA
jgi:hypothetical protein